MRTSSGGLSGALGSALVAGGAGAASGRGAGPDHREVRYADGVLAMINVLRLLTLGGPRTWDATAYKQVTTCSHPVVRVTALHNFRLLLLHASAAVIQPYAAIALSHAHLESHW